MLIATLSLTFTSEHAAEGAAIMDRALAETRDFAGCLGVEVLVQDDDPTRWLVVERWESLAADDAYRAFRRSDGAITDLEPTLAAPPTLTRWLPRGD